MKHIQNINERYKETPYLKPKEFVLYSVRNYVDDVFDHLMDIICNVNGISEKSFKQLDDTKKYIEGVFDNNQEILIDIDNMSNKRYQYTAEVIYDKYFNNKKEIAE